MDTKALRMREEWPIPGRNGRAAAKHAASLIEGGRCIDVQAESQAYADMAGQRADDVEDPFLVWLML